MTFDPTVGVLVPPDLELYLTGYVRAALRDRPEPVCRNVQVDRAEPDAGETRPTRLVVIRDDGGTPETEVTEEHSLGVTVLAGTKADPTDAALLARIVWGILRASPSPRSPIVAHRGGTTPVLVASQEAQARSYQTHTLVCATA